MIPELGHFALIIALSLAIIQGTLPLAGTFTGKQSWVALARPVAQGQFIFILLSFLCLTYAFVNNDFSVLYVASHSNSALPIQYRISAVWGGHEGSLLLWVMMLGMWTFAVTIFSKHLPDEMVARVVSVLGLISIGFLLFLILTSNPFDRLIPAAMDGRDLNPLLQDPGLVIHPPMLYMGYVGFSVAFAFAIAALLGGKLDAAWARWSRPWTTVAWMFLTIGIALGSWWAYYELGWGGWWFWDPVENASFMPWLVGTALIHSLAVTEKRGSFKNWTVLLAIIAFSLSLLGTFLVRSGVLTSVHSFASDPERGVFILGFLAVVVGSSLTLYAWRAPKVGLGGGFEIVSRETMLLLNNVMFIVAAGTVLLGTIYPLVLDALGAGKISVGAPFFEAIFAPLMLSMVFLMGIGPISRWKKADLPDLMIRLKWAMAVSIVSAMVVPFTMGEWYPMVSLGVLAAFWIITTVAYGFIRRIKRNQAIGKPGLSGMTRSYYGMQLAHIGVAVFILGVGLVRGYETEKDVRMSLGDTLTVGEYVFRFDGVVNTQGPNYRASQGKVHVTKNGKDEVTLYPEKRVYNVQTMPMTEAAIDSGLFRDLYVSLGEPVSGGAWSVRVYHKPFVDWIWGGAGLMAIGGLFAISDRRYRLALRKKTRPQHQSHSSDAATGKADLVTEGE
ncbi:MAG: heme lyase CcmF/NrfE family subunit [Gammaproteobacteria bacterium]